MTESVSRAHSQAGFSLTESLAAIMLTSVIILGIAAGILTALKATRTVSRIQTTEAALSDATESIKAQPYQSCAGLGAYTATADVTVTTVEYLQAGGNGEHFGPVCDPATDTAQRVTVVVRGRSADVVKRDPVGATP